MLLILFNEKSVKNMHAVLHMKKNKTYYNVLLFTLTCYKNILEEKKVLKTKVTSPSGLQRITKSLYWDTGTLEKHSQRFLANDLAGKCEYHRHDHKTTGKN